MLGERVRWDELYMFYHYGAQAYRRCIFAPHVLPSLEARFHFPYATCSYYVSQPVASLYTKFHSDSYFFPFSIHTKHYASSINSWTAIPVPLAIF